MAALADAFGLCGRDVVVVTGTRRRDKIVELHGEKPVLRARLERLLDAP